MHPIPPGGSQISKDFLLGEGGASGLFRRVACILRTMTKIVIILFLDLCKT